MDFIDKMKELAKKDITKKANENNIDLKNIQIINPQNSEKLD